MFNNKNQQSDLWVIDEILPYKDSLKAWLNKRFHRLSDVDDVVQESIFRVMKAHSSGPIINPRAYLFLTARNIVYNRFRHSKYENIIEAKEFNIESILDNLDDPLEEISKKEETKALIQAIKTLPPRCRQVITLRKIYGYSLKEVAKILGISVKTVEVQSRIALRKCSEYFKKNGFWGENDS